MSPMSQFKTELLTSQIMAHKYVLLSLIATISVYCALQLPDLKFSGDIGAYVDGSDAELQAFLRDTETFGSSETFILVIQANGGSGTFAHLYTILRRPEYRDAATTT
jgi:predicted RND superfamily exporter protein